MGSRLLNRSTRSVAPTEAGSALFERIAPALADIRGAVDEASGTPKSPAGTVRLNMPKIAALLLASRLSRFAREHPSIRVELTTDDGFSDIVAGGFDAGVRLGEHLQGDMIAVRITPDLRCAIVGAPAYFAAHRPPRTPQELDGHACINYRFAYSGALYRWPFAHGGRSLDVAVEGVLTLDDADLVVAAALHGAGLACTLEERVAEHLNSGRLVRVLDDWCQPFSGFHLYYPGRRQLPLPLQTLVEFLRSKTATQVGQLGM